MIYPKVVGKTIGLPGIWVLTAITIGGGILGIPGMLLSVPLFSAGYRLLKEDVAKRNPTTDKEAENPEPQVPIEDKEQEEEVPAPEDTTTDEK